MTIYGHAGIASYCRGAPPAFEVRSCQGCGAPHLCAWSSYESRCFECRRRWLLERLGRAVATPGVFAVGPWRSFVCGLRLDRNYLDKDDVPELDAWLAERGWPPGSSATLMERLRSDLALLECYDDERDRRDSAP